MNEVLRELEQRQAMRAQNNCVQILAALGDIESALVVLSAQLPSVTDAAARHDILFKLDQVDCVIVDLIERLRAKKS